MSQENGSRFAHGKCWHSFFDWSRPPLSSRIIRWVDRIYLFFGLYLVTLFAVWISISLNFTSSYLVIRYVLGHHTFVVWSVTKFFSLHTLYHQITNVLTYCEQLDSYAAADKSQFNITSSRNQAWTRPRWGGSADRGNNNGGGSGGSGGGRPDDGGSGFGGRRVGRITDFNNAPVYKTTCCQWWLASMDGEVGVKQTLWIWDIVPEVNIPSYVHISRLYKERLGLRRLELTGDAMGLLVLQITFLVE
jgi:hypothetical protein